MKSLRLLIDYLRHNLMSGLAYRGAFFLQVFGMMLNNFMLLFFWSVLFDRFSALNGWDLQGIITIYAIVALGYGLSVVVCGNGGRLSRIITSGDLDYYLALPADPLVHVLVSRMVLPGLGDVLFGLVLYLLFVPQSLVKLPLLLLLGLLTALIFVAFNVIVGSLAFWLGQSENLAMQLRNAVLTFSLYPVDIFPGLVRLFLYTLLPAAFIGSIPASLLAEFDMKQLLLLTVFSVGLWWVARQIFRWGLRGYESGNLVTTRG